MIFAGAFYTDLRNAQNFPFLSQVLFSEASNSTNPNQWNQSAVIGPDNLIDQAALTVEGLPWSATTYAISLVITDIYVTAAMTHPCLCYRPEMKETLAFLYPCLSNVYSTQRLGISAFGSPASSRMKFTIITISTTSSCLPTTFAQTGGRGVLIVSVVVALIVLYKGNSTLPRCAVGSLDRLSHSLFLHYTLRCCASYHWDPFSITPIIQMVGGYIQPGNPVANMYFTLYGYNSMTQGNLPLQDLKLAQYCHLAPKLAFMVQISGTSIGAIFNYIMMNSIVDHQQDTLLSVEGTNIWSGQSLQHSIYLVSSLYQGRGLQPCR